MVTQVVRLKVCDSHPTCKVANECLNVKERVDVVELNKRLFPPFPFCPVSRQCPRMQNPGRIFFFFYGMTKIRIIII